MADKQRKIELLAPAGNWERFVTAIQFGADAVYLGTTAFSLRNLADNFTLEQVAEAVRYAHERSVKVYVTVNAFMRDEDLENLPEPNVLAQSIVAGLRDALSAFGDVESELKK